MGLVHGKGSVSVGICFAPAEGGDEQTHWDGGRHTTHGNRAGGREGEMHVPSDSALVLLLPLLPSFKAYSDAESFLKPLSAPRWANTYARGEAGCQSPPSPWLPNCPNPAWPPLPAAHPRQSQGKAQMKVINTHSKKYIFKKVPWFQQVERNRKNKVSTGLRRKGAI